MLHISYPTRKTHSLKLIVILATVPANRNKVSSVSSTRTSGYHSGEMGNKNENFFYSHNKIYFTTPLAVLHDWNCTMLYLQFQWCAHAFQNTFTAHFLRLFCASKHGVWKHHKIIIIKEEEFSALQHVCYSRHDKAVSDVCRVCNTLAFDLHQTTNQPSASSVVAAETRYLNTVSWSRGINKICEGAVGVVATHKIWWCMYLEPIWAKERFSCWLTNSTEESRFLLVCSKW